MQIVERGKSVAGLVRNSVRAVQARSGVIWRTVGWRAEYASLWLRAWVHRARLRGVTWVGITGSAGKTTTKDLCAGILATRGPCVSTVRSENEPVFIARTVLDAAPRHRFCVVELAAFRPGYMEKSARLVQPDIAVLTLIARDHFSAFKSVEAIAEEKGKLIEALKPTGTAVLNIDDPLVRAIGERCKARVIWFGKDDGAAVKLLSARSDWPEPLTLEVEFEGRPITVRTALHGTQLVLPVLAALGVGVAAGVPIEQAIAALASVPAAEARMQIVEGEDGVVFVRDDWKAPYWSLEAPLAFMKTARAARKVVVVGTLSDYSLSASKIYPKVARQAREVGDLVVFVGPHAMRALKARRHAQDSALQAFPDVREAAAFLRTELRAGDLVLLKGSNKADHLVRIILDRIRPIECWRERCGHKRFCNRCALLYEPMKGRAEPAAQVLPAATAPAPLGALGGAAATPVVVGLGNPGERYCRTPHNIGYRVVDELARAGASGWESHPAGLVSTITVNGAQVRLLKPGVNINRSGPSVRHFMEAAGGDAARCIVVHDDMDLEIGDVRLKRNGGDAGHKGMRSVIAALGTGEVPRIRVGVRRAGDERQAKQLVLAEFSEAEEVAVARGVAQATEKVHDVIRELSADQPGRSDAQRAR